MARRTPFGTATSAEKSASEDAQLTAEMLKKAGLAWADELEAHVSGSAIIVTKKRMSVNDLRETMTSLVALATEFKERANEICAGCDGEGCPYLEDESGEGQRRRMDPVLSA